MALVTSNYVPDFNFAPLDYSPGLSFPAPTYIDPYAMPYYNPTPILVPVPVVATPAMPPPVVVAAPVVAAPVAVAAPVVAAAPAVAAPVVAEEVIDTGISWATILLILGVLIILGIIIALVCFFTSSGNTISNTPPTNGTANTLTAFRPTPTVPTDPVSISTANALDDGFITVYIKNTTGNNTLYYAVQSVYTDTSVLNPISVVKNVSFDNNGVPVWTESVPNSSLANIGPGGTLIDSQYILQGDGNYHTIIIPASPLTTLSHGRLFIFDSYDWGVSYGLLDSNGFILDISSFPSDTDPVSGLPNDVMAQVINFEMDSSGMFRMWIDNSLAFNFPVTYSLGVTNGTSGSVPDATTNKSFLGPVGFSPSRETLVNSLVTSYSSQESVATNSGVPTPYWSTGIIYKNNSTQVKRIVAPELLSGQDFYPSADIVAPPPTVTVTTYYGQYINSVWNSTTTVWPKIFSTDGVTCLLLPGTSYISNPSYTYTQLYNSMINDPAVQDALVEIYGISSLPTTSDIDTLVTDGFIIFGAVVPGSVTTTNLYTQSQTPSYYLVKPTTAAVFRDDAVFDPLAVSVNSPPGFNSDYDAAIKNTVCLALNRSVFDNPTNTWTNQSDYYMPNFATPVTNVYAQQLHLAALNWDGSPRVRTFNLDWDNSPLLSTNFNRLLLINIVLPPWFS
jgi:hypothetical protein